MLVRIASGAVLTVIVGAGLVLGGPYLFLLTLVISIIGMYELYRVYGIEKSPIGIIGYVFAVVYYICMWLGQNEFMLLSLAAGLICIMAGYVVKFPKYKADQAAMGFFALVYVAAMISFIYRIRLLEDGAFYVWLVFICSWIADTCAYFVGVKFGKHKMTPVLSPKKSIEGAIGGILGPMLIGGIYGAVINSRISVNAPVVFAVACGVGAGISIIGDLAASAIKRDHSVKDYGKLIPGHGGILDRFDSTIFTAPVVYIVLEIFRAVG